MTEQTEQTNDAADEDVEMALVIESADAKLEEELSALLPGRERSSSDNFVGGAEIAVFFAYAKDVLASILGFVSQNRDRIKNAKVTIGRNSIDLQGYAAEDVEKLLGSPAFASAMKSVRGR